MSGFSADKAMKNAQNAINRVNHLDTEITETVLCPAHLLRICCNHCFNDNTKYSSQLRSAGGRHQEIHQTAENSGATLLCFALSCRPPELRVCLFHRTTNSPL